MTYRMGALTPWYHQIRPRCSAQILVTKEQCLFSARYEDTEGRGIFLCKPHAQMVDFKTRLIRPKRVAVR